MALKLAHAFGAHTTLFTTSPGKQDDARRLGADEVVVTRDAAAMKAAPRNFDVIINTVAAAHNLDPYLGLLGRDGTMVMLGAPPRSHHV